MFTLSKHNHFLSTQTLSDLNWIQINVYFTPSDKTEGKISHKI